MMYNYQISGTVYTKQMQVYIYIYIYLKTQLYNRAELMKKVEKAEQLNLLLIVSYQHHDLHAAVTN